MRRILTILILFGAVFGSVVAAPGSATASGGYLSGKFTHRTVDRFTRDLAKVGIGVYRPGARRPVRMVRGRQSPLRMSTDEAVTAALGARAGVGMSAGTLDALGGPVPLIGKAKLRMGATHYAQK